MCVLRDLEVEWNGSCLLWVDNWKKEHEKYDDTLMSAKNS